MNNIILKFLSETVQRLFMKSPKFFKIWKIIGGIALILSGLPEIINSLQGIGFKIPQLLNDRVNLIVTIASAVMVFMTSLTTQSTAVAVTEGGAVIKATDAGKLPFTKVTENKDASDAGVPKIRSGDKPFQIMNALEDAAANKI